MPNLFPEGTNLISDASQTSQDTTAVTFGRSWSFDFENGDFVQTPTGKVANIQDEDAWLEWCQKSIMTDRYMYLIYGRNYGQEYKDLIRRNLSRAGNESEIKRITTECLMVDPRTASVDNFIFNWESDGCYFTCDIYSVRGTSGQVTGKVVTG